MERFVISARFGLAMISERRSHRFVGVPLGIDTSCCQRSCSNHVPCYRSNHSLPRLTSKTHARPHSDDHFLPLARSSTPFRARGTLCQRFGSPHRDWLDTQIETVQISLLSVDMRDPCLRRARRWIQTIIGRIESLGRSSFLAALPHRFVSAPYLTQHKTHRSNFQVDNFSVLGRQASSSRPAILRNKPPAVPVDL